MTTANPLAPRRHKRHPLAGDGPIVDRARRALRSTAEHFGSVQGTDRTTVTVRTKDGIEIVFSYDPGNYVFSRVYACTISTVLPDTTDVPATVSLTHRGTQRGGRFVAGRVSAHSECAVDRLNRATASHLAGIDLVRASIATTKNSGKRLTLSPMGGSFVWVLIPPVFKATAFPPGEPERILELIRAVRGLTHSKPHSSSP
ncbi:hypothetical protein G7067_07350 [Leucobacter insecticola]|uniref:Uncharacterized protein n=1 Tax=Leucobacter insecticola TaxID=2714934 RepID=A0A6G8FJP4_9MICO|nr:hypothetical protein [Leucobacter insecticola]QIM16282.1 hypothetical protein G7067_07350 [Leucobacter insecticola]